MTCEHDIHGVCEVASHLAGCDVENSSVLCRFCLLSPTGAGQNLHTISKAIQGQMRKRGRASHDLLELYAGYCQAYASGGNVVKSNRVIEDQREHWILLHEYSFQVQTWNPDVAAIWFRDWCNSVPGCSECTTKLYRYLSDLPFRFSTPLVFFRHGFDLHNFVNNNLGKPVLQFDEAVAMYNRNYTHDTIIRDQS